MRRRYRRQPPGPAAERARQDGTYVPLAGPATISGLKDFTTAPTVNGAPIGGAVDGSALDLLGALRTNKRHAATAAQRAVLGNGLSKPLSGFYASLAAAQVDYPHVVSLNDELDWAVNQAAVNAAAAAGAGTVFCGDDFTYLHHRPLFLGSNVELWLGTSTITKPASIRTLLTANAVAGATSVTVTDATGFKVGGPIHLADTSSFEFLSTQGVITAIVGNTITFSNDEGLGRTGLDAAVQTTRSAFASTSFPLIRNVKAASGMKVIGGTFNQAKNAADPGFDGTFGDFTLSTIHWVEAYRATVENVTMLNAPADAYSDQANDGTGVTLTAANIKTTKNTIRGCRIRDANRHGIHLGTAMNGAFVLGNEVTNCGYTGGVGYGIFYCAFVTNTVVSGNLIEGCGQGLAGIDERDVNNVITGNVIKNSFTWAIGTMGAGTGGKCTITGNVIVGNRGILWTEPDTTITGNVVELNGGNPGIQLTATGDRCLIGFNVFRGGTAGSQHLYLSGADDVRVIGNMMSGGVNATDIRGMTRMVAIGNHMSAFTTAQGWVFNTTTSVDCVIKDERNALTTPVLENVAATRLVYEGLATNGSADPAVSGPWFGVTGRRYDGTQIYWFDGTNHRLSVFRNDVGMIALN